MKTNTKRSLNKILQGSGFKLTEKSISTIVECLVGNISLVLLINIQCVVYPIFDVFLRYLKHQQRYTTVFFFVTEIQGEIENLCF